MTTAASPTRSEAGRATDSAPRTLAEDLRGRSDDALGALLRARPDLTTPVPVDLTQLSTRATTRASIARALERLDRFTLQVVDAAVVLPDGFSAARLHQLVGEDPAAFARAVANLREQALLWGPDDALKVVRTVRDLVGASPAGLGPTLAGALAATSASRLRDLLADLGLGSTHDAVSAIAAITERYTDPIALDALLDQAPAAAREVLDKLVWGPPTGSVRGAERPVRVDAAHTPVEWLLARALLVPIGPDTVVLPREIALHLRGGRVHRAPEPAPPALVVRAHDPRSVDALAAGSAFTAVRRIEDLLELWSAGGPAVLRAGGLGMREFKRTAGQLDISEAETALWLETAYAMGLLADDDEPDEQWLPTPAFDTWRRAPIGTRWAALAGTWLETTRVPALVGTRDDKDRPVGALGMHVDRTAAPEVRRRILTTLASLPPGTAADADSLLAHLTWHQPIRAARLSESLFRALLVEAELIGLTGRGALADYARSLVDGRVYEAGDALAPLLPRPLDHVLLQADLTAVAPGPLEVELAHELHLAADIESTGGATVYRFTENSVRRALDAGRTATELHHLLATHSRTPVPQPLTYLVDDVARRHGRIRVGTAGAFLRCDDDALLGELLADRRAASLRLRRLAPTVLAAESSPDAVLAKLRAMSFAPVAESATGDLVLTRPDTRRTPPRSAPPRVAGEPPAPGEALLAAAVNAIRAGDAAATSRVEDGARPPGEPAELPRTSAAETLLALQAAAAERRAVWIGHVTREGRATQHVVIPLRLEGGYVTAHEQTTGEIHTYPLHRITGVADIARDDPPART